ncbi:unnamed protein product [Sympodiomycopsis kandeliae]
MAPWPSRSPKSLESKPSTHPIDQVTFRSSIQQYLLAIKMVTCSKADLRWVPVLSTQLFQGILEGSRPSTAELLELKQLSLFEASPSPAYLLRLYH